MSLLDDILARLELLPKNQLDTLEAKVREAMGAPPWIPTVGPQLEAYESEADELFYGGSAGCSKTDLLVGLSLTQHRRSLVLRRTNKEASKLTERYVELLGSREGFNGSENTWHLPEGRVIDIGGCQHEDDRQKYKGTPHDFIGFDEIADFSESQFRFIITWNRSSDPSSAAVSSPPVTLRRRQKGFGSSNTGRPGSTTRTRTPPSRANCAGSPTSPAGPGGRRPGSAPHQRREGHGALAYLHTGSTVRQPIPRPHKLRGDTRRAPRRASRCLPRRSLRSEPQR